jgi:hypothetical protein
MKSQKWRWHTQSQARPRRLIDAAIFSKSAAGSWMLGRNIARRRRGRQALSYHWGETVDEYRWIAPPDPTADLREAIKKQYPTADGVVISSVAFIIDAQINFLVRSQSTIKIMGKPRHWPKQYVRGHRYPNSWSWTRKRSLANELRSLERAAKSKSAWVWARAWHESSPEVIGLLDEVAGSEGIWTDVPKHLPLHPNWERVIAKLNAEHGFETPANDLSIGSTNFARNVAGVSIPTPRTIAPLIPVAIRRARPGRPARWQRDVAVAAIARQFERLTGEHPRQASKAGLSTRSGRFTTFLDELEAFYDRKFSPEFGPIKFGVQKSGRNTSRILGGTSR